MAKGQAPLPCFPKISFFPPEFVTESHLLLILN